MIEPGGDGFEADFGEATIAEMEPITPVPTEAPKVQMQNPADIRAGFGQAQSDVFRPDAKQQLAGMETVAEGAQADGTDSAATPTEETTPPEQLTPEQVQGVTINRPDLIAKLDQYYSEEDKANLKLDEMSDSDLIDFVYRNQLVAEIPDINPQTAEWLKGKDLPVEEVEKLVKEAKSLNVLSDVFEEYKNSPEPMNAFVESLREAATEQGEDPEQVNPRLDAIKKKLMNLLENSTDATLLVLASLSKGIVTSFTEDSSLSDFLSNFLGRSVDSFGSGGSYKWGKEEGSDKAIGREEFLKKFQNPGEFAKGFRKAWEAERGMKEWLELDDAQKALLEKAENDNDAEALRQILILFAKKVTKEDDDQGTHWQNARQFLALHLFGKDDQFLSGKVNTYLRDELKKGTDKAFVTDLPKVEQAAPVTSDDESA